MEYSEYLENLIFEQNPIDALSALIWCMSEDDKMFYFPDALNELGVEFMEQEEYEETQ